MKKTVFALIASVAFSAGATAQVRVTDPWVRATVPQQTSTGAFMLLQSATATRLVEVRSPVAGAAELHRMQVRGDRMKMQQVDGIDLPAGRVVNLASGGYHIMLTNLKRPLREGDLVPLTLVMQDRNKKRETVTLTVPVKPFTHVGPQTGASSHR